MKINDIQLNEGYEDKVFSIAQKVMADNIEFDNKKQLINKIFNLAVNDKISDVMVSQKAKTDFIKDVLDNLKGKVKFKRIKKIDPSKPTLNQLSFLIQDAVSNSFPDGDPFDTIQDKFQKNNWNLKYLNVENLDKAAKLLGSKSYNDYMADMWDDVKNDDYLELGDKNPWR